MGSSMGKLSCAGRWELEGPVVLGRTPPNPLSAVDNADPLGARPPRGPPNQGRSVLDHRCADGRGWSGGGLRWGWHSPPVEL